MIFTAFVVLAFVFQAVRPTPASAVSLAECEAYLCLPAGFSTHGGTPSNACDPAYAAVLRRLRLHLDPLPPWSSCAAQFGWDRAHLAWTFPIDTTCPSGGSLNGAGMCSGEDADGCLYTYSPREHGHVWVWVDGARTGQSLPYTVAHATSPTVDPLSCPPDIPDLDDGCLTCGDDCPEGWFWSEGLGKCINPLVVGPPVPGAPCNTIWCPHVQHTWGANPLEIHWTLRTAPLPPARAALAAEPAGACPSAVHFPKT